MATAERRRQACPLRAPRRRDNGTATGSRSRGAPCAAMRPTVRGRSGAFMQAAQGWQCGKAPTPAGFRAARTRTSAASTCSSAAPPQGAEELRPGNRAGALPRALGHAVLRLGALQRGHPPALAAQRHRGARRAGADPSTRRFSSREDRAQPGHGRHRQPVSGRCNDLKSPVWPEAILGLIDVAKANSRTGDLYDRLCVALPSGHRSRVARPARPGRGRGRRHRHPHVRSAEHRNGPAAGADLRAAQGDALRRSAGPRKLRAPGRANWRPGRFRSNGSTSCQPMPDGPRRSISGDRTSFALCWHTGRGRSTAFGRRRPFCQRLGAFALPAPASGKPAEQGLLCRELGVQSGNGRLRVGKSFEGAYKYDVSLPGNSNAGHEYGTESLSHHYWQSADRIPQDVVIGPALAGGGDLRKTAGLRRDFGLAAQTRFNTISTGYFLPINEFVRSYRVGMSPKRQSVATLPQIFPY